MLPLQTITQIILTLTFIASQKIGAVYLTTDQLQNAYVITSDNSFMKLDSSGTVLYTYSEKRFGHPEMADATNPMKIMLSFPDYAMIVYLDNTLSEIGTISLRNAGIDSYSAACYSPSDNVTWVFDTKEYKLKKVDRNQQVVFASSDMFSVLGFAIHPVSMHEVNQMIYLSDPELGIFVFDVYGGPAQTIAIKDANQFQVKNDQLFFTIDSVLYSYHLQTFEKKEIVLPDSIHASQIRIERNRVYALEEGVVSFYED